MTRDTASQAGSSLASCGQDASTRVKLGSTR